MWSALKQACKVFYRMNHSNSLCNIICHWRTDSFHPHAGVFTAYNLTGETASPTSYAVKSNVITFLREFMWVMCLDKLLFFYFLNLVVFAPKSWVIIRDGIEAAVFFSSFYFYSIRKKISLASVVFFKWLTSNKRCSRSSLFLVIILGHSLLHLKII